jgi:uncharacterized protein (DUF1810 family)
MQDPFALQRFVEAQDRVYEQVLRELGAGRKTSHWMWFVFPQVAGLGTSPMAARYAIGSRAEATAYAENPVLGPRLRECTEAVIAVEGRTAHQIFGSPDDLKFRSCMTLFSLCAPDRELFRAALDKYFDGAGDGVTERLLNQAER